MQETVGNTIFQFFVYDTEDLLSNAIHYCIELIGYYKKEIMNIYIFGNGNISFHDFKLHYEQLINRFLEEDTVMFSVCDFKGVDTLTMELLKCNTTNVAVYHIGDQPRYFPDKFKTKVSSWHIVGGFENDEQRDLAVIKNCTHFIAVDFNSDTIRKSGTQKNIERCEQLGKIRLTNG